MRKREPKIGRWVTLPVLTFPIRVSSARPPEPVAQRKHVSVHATHIPRVFAGSAESKEEREIDFCMPLRLGVLEHGSHSEKNIIPNKLQKYHSSTAMLVNLLKPFRGWFGGDWSGWRAQKTVLVSTKRFWGSAGVPGRSGRGVATSRPPTPRPPKRPVLTKTKLSASNHVLVPPNHPRNAFVMHTNLSCKLHERWELI